MSKRQYLSGTIRLYEDISGAGFGRDFTIVRVISEGADGVCYEAYHDRSGKGVLKEFYPLRVIGLERDDEGQLRHSVEFRSSLRKYRDARTDFLRPYEMLLRIRQEGDSDIASFIPAFEIVYGSRADDDDEPAVYIWTPEPSLVTFDRICDEIHARPQDKPEHKLVTVLSAAETLTKCICALHSSDIIHRDIKPSNFGFVRRRGETLTQTLCMFDLDSLCSVWSDPEEVRGTRGYMEPEAGRMDISNQTDIYSIGATLFSAIIINDETRGDDYVYNDRYYSRLKDMVDSSELILASEANSDPRLRYILTMILRKCLAPRKYRYENCEELLRDLGEAMFYALPPEISRMSRTGEKWVLSKADRILDSHADRNSFLAILYHLYEVPLYKYSDYTDGSLNIAVTGSGRLAQRFIDACLQAGQMRGRTLNITVYTDDISDREIFLADRPELGEFFIIDGRMDFAYGSGAEPYGCISFRSVNYAEHEDILVRKIFGGCSGGDPHYVFVAHGTGKSNRDIAGRMLRYSDEKGIRCAVTYASDGEGEGKIRDERLSILNVDRDLRKSRHYKEIERMAFNAHLIWNNDINVSISSLRKDFRKKYNHDASVSNVISMKYKLWSIGIDLDKMKPEEAAGAFTALYEQDGHLRDELIWIEHRRWVTEKLCAGWRCLRDLRTCPDRGTKDARRRLHVCIVRSRPDHMLRELTVPEGRYTWDDLPEDELVRLDDLDRLSVELHRVYASRASELRRSDILMQTLLGGIETAVSCSDSLHDDFTVWRECVYYIWNGDSMAVRRYRGLRQEMLESAGHAGKAERVLLEHQVATFEAWFRPVMACMEYRDWKELDNALVSRIPYMLTNKA